MTGAEKVGLTEGARTTADGNITLTVRACLFGRLTDDLCSEM